MGRLDARRILIAGGGVAALEAMLALCRLSEERLEVELLAPERAFVYRPLAVAEPFGLGRVRRFDVETLVADAGCEYRADRLAEVRPDEHTAVTGTGAELEYGALLLAYGAVLREGLAGAITFWGTADELPFRGLLHDIEHRAVNRVAFAVGGWTSWALPLYELALMTAAHAATTGAEARLAIVSHESTPLEVFGVAASHRVAETLADRGIEFVGNAHPAEVVDDGLRLAPGSIVPAERVVTMPAIEGRPMPGVPADPSGFVPVDERCRVLGLDDVFAAGDATSFPVKQGGIAAQQGEVVARQIARRTGSDVVAEPFRPVLRGLLLTGGEPAFLRNELAGGAGETSAAAASALWWPPGKIAGRHLGPHLAALTNGDLSVEPPPSGHPVEIELPLDDPGVGPSLG